LPKAVPCTTGTDSFTVTNKESVPEFIQVTGTQHFKGTSGTLAPGGSHGFCARKGYEGTVTVTLLDGKKLTVKF
jgi:hypothetical protein